MSSVQLVPEKEKSIAATQRVGGNGAQRFANSSSLATKGGGRGAQ